MAKIDVKSSVVVHKDLLEKALSSMRLIFSRSRGSMGASIIIQPDENKLQMIADDGGVLVRTTALTEEIKDLNRWCVDGVMLSKFIKTMEKGEITLQSDDTNLYTLQKKTKLKIPLSEVSKEPAEYDINEMVKLNLNPGKFIKGLEQVSHACSNLAVNVVMQGVLINYTNKGFELVATDSKRMGHYSTIEADRSEVEDLYSAVIHKSMADEIIKLFEGTNFNIYIKTASFESDGSDPFVETVAIVNDEIQFFVKTINLAFPSYKEILTNPATKEIEVEKSELLSKIRQVGASADKCQVIINQEGITLKSIEGALNSEVEVFLECETQPTFELNTAFVNKYIEESLRVIKSKSIKMRFEEEEKAFFLLENHEETNNNRYAEVMMPYIGKYN